MFGLIFSEHAFKTLDSQPSRCLFTQAQTGPRASQFLCEAAASSCSQQGAFLPKAKLLHHCILISSLKEGFKNIYDGCWCYFHHLPFLFFCNSGLSHAPGNRCISLTSVQAPQDSIKTRQHDHLRRCQNNHTITFIRFLCCKKYQKDSQFTVGKELCILITAK